MRQGHQNRRGRNRNNGGARKGHNPVSRSYESNGPDMKIRGTPAHIAEKYVALSRDAQSNGDPVLAENYLQHAEHYNRIILAYRDAQAQQHPTEQPTGGPNGNGQHRSATNQEQPTIEDAEQPDVASSEAAPASSNPMPTRRQPRGRQGDNQGRQSRGRKPRAAESDDASQERRSEQTGVPEHEQPEFLRRSIRRPRRDANKDTDPPVAAEDSTQD